MLLSDLVGATMSPYSQLFLNVTMYPIVVTADQSAVVGYSTPGEQNAALNLEVSWNTSGLAEGGGPLLCNAPELPQCCAPCFPGYVGDGLCDSACNVPECNFDGGDCEGGYGGYGDYGDGSFPGPYPPYPGPYPDPGYGYGYGPLPPFPGDGYGGYGGYGIPPGGCSPGCPDAWIGDGICDPPCQVPACGMDEGDCDGFNGGYGGYGGYGPFPPPPPGQDCAPGCPSYWIGDGVCDQACLVPECGMDAGDCDTDSGYCAPGCPDYWIGDNYCDDACYVAECDWDAAGLHVRAGVLSTTARRRLLQRRVQR
jgi:hypothetical protein